MKKIAFCFLCKNGIKNKALWAKFFNGNEDRYNLYFHCSDPHTEIKDNLILNHLVPQFYTAWGDLYGGVCSMYNFALRNDNYKYILLSESCIPLKSFNSVYEFLVKDNLSYVCYQDHIARNKNERGTLIQSYERFIANAKRSPTFMYEISIKNWYFHEMWTILNKEHVKLIMSNHFIIETFRSMKCFAYDENIVAYILSLNNQLQNVKSLKTTFSNWHEASTDKKGGRHPKSYSEVLKKDLEMFNPYLFGRKFENIKGIEKIIELKDYIY